MSVGNLEKGHIVYPDENSRFDDFLNRVPRPTTLASLKAMTVRDFLSEAMMLAIVIVIGGAVSLFIVTAFLLIMGQHTWLDNFDNRSEPDQRQAPLPESQLGEAYRAHSV